MRELEKERARKLLESVEVKKKKRRGCTNDGYKCVVDKMQEKKKRKKKRMDKRKGKE